MKTIKTIAACFLVFACTGTTTAMTCDAPEANLNDALDDAEYVFVGLLITATDPRGDNLIDATFQVERQVKGPSLVNPSFERVFAGGSACGLDVRLGGHYIVFADSEHGSLRMQTSTTLVNENRYVGGWVARLIDSGITR